MHIKTFLNILLIQFVLSFVFLAIALIHAYKPKNSLKLSKEFNPIVSIEPFDIERAKRNFLYAEPEQKLEHILYVFNGLSAKEAIEKMKNSTDFFRKSVDRKNLNNQNRLNGINRRLHCPSFR